MKILKITDSKLFLIFFIVSIFSFTSCATSLCEAYTMNDEIKTKENNKQEKETRPKSIYI